MKKILLFIVVVSMYGCGGNLEKSALLPSIPPNWRISGTSLKPIKNTLTIESEKAAGEPVFKVIGTTDTPTSNPETEAESGWIEIIIGSTPYYIPYYD